MSQVGKDVGFHSINLVDPAGGYSLPPGESGAGPLPQRGVRTGFLGLAAVDFHLRPLLAIVNSVEYLSPHTQSGCWGGC